MNRVLVRISTYETTKSEVKRVSKDFIPPFPDLTSEWWTESEVFVVEGGGMDGDI